jgi:hypothetical protein
MIRFGHYERTVLLLVRVVVHLLLLQQELESVSQEAYLSLQSIRKRRLASYDLIVYQFRLVQVPDGLERHASEALHPIAVFELFLQPLYDI